MRGEFISLGYRSFVFVLMSIQPNILFSFALINNAWLNKFVSNGGKLNSSVKDVIKTTGMADKLPRFISSAR